MGKQDYRPDTFQDSCVDISEEISNLVLSKQRDYGQGNILAFGEFGVLVRSSDKFERLKNLLKEGKAPNNESIEDTWKDIAGYAILALMLRRGTFTLPLRK